MCVVNSGVLVVVLVAVGWRYSCGLENAEHGFFLSMVVDVKFEFTM